MFNIRDTHWEGKRKEDLGYRAKIDEMIAAGKFELIDKNPVVWLRGHETEIENYKEQPGWVIALRRKD